MSMDATTEAAHRLIVSSLVDYVSAGDDDVDADMDVDIVGGHQTAFITACIERVGRDRIETREGLGEFIELVIGELLLTGGLLFKVAFEAFVADDVADRDPNRAVVFATMADGAGSLLAQSDDE